MITRPVDIDDMLYRHHEVMWICHRQDEEKTVVRVQSSNGVEQGNEEVSLPASVITEYDLPLDVGMTFAQAEETVFALPSFARVPDPYEGIVDEIASMLDDEQAATVPQAFKEWKPDTAYAIGDRRRFANVLYKCLQAHTSQKGYGPDVTTSLWARILNPDPGVIPEWEQPDSTNPYMKGDKVTHNGHTWESDVDNNVWEPGVYGWTQIG